MALNNAERDMISAWADQVRTASTWVSGRNAKMLVNIADQMNQVAEGEASAKDLAAE